MRVTSVRICEAGDSAMLLQLGAGPGAGTDQIDATLNARAVRIAQAVRDCRLPGVRDVVATFQSVAVFFDPLVADSAAVAAALEKSGAEPHAEQPGKVVEVPVVYGGDAGPDLDHVASVAGVSPETVIERHSVRPYRVFMLGFLPGFPYLATVDEVIAAPRREVPRTRVPAGSVGIAGRQTGIYPRESPGGWQIIGRTPLEMFDTGRPSPALLAPGDTVRFVPVAPEAVSGFSRTGVEVRLKPDTTYDSNTYDSSTYDSSTYDSAARHITVLRPGLFTTIQDSGRWGYQHLGVPVSGPMDALSHRLANMLLGNTFDSAVLEATMLGPELRFEHRARIAIAGADLNPTLDGAPLLTTRTVECPAGSVLRFGDRRSGARTYIAVDGGITVPRVLGSRSTHVMSGLGGREGRALRAGDRIPLGEPAPQSRMTTPRELPKHTDSARLRVMKGPQFDHFHPSALEALQCIRFTISPQSDRMGYRLSGGTLGEANRSGEMVSDATVAGAVQVPPSGQPILLMADRQTTGGYPQIAVVITADLPLAAQLAPGDTVTFELCTRLDAIAALRQQEGSFVGG